MFYELVDKLYEKYSKMHKYVPDEYFNIYKYEDFEDIQYNERINFLLSIFHCMINHYCILINQAIEEENRILSMDITNPLRLLVQDIYNFLESSIDQKSTIVISNKSCNGLVYYYKNWLIKDSYSEITSRINKYDIVINKAIFDISPNPRFEDDSLSPDFIGKGGYATVTKFILPEYGLCFAKKKLNPV